MEQCVSNRPLLDKAADSKWHTEAGIPQECLNHAEKGRRKGFAGMGLFTHMVFPMRIL